MSDESIEQAVEAERVLKSLPQVFITTDHILHAGVYIRTVMIPKDVVITGALMKRSTNLIISGHVLVFIGNDKVREYKGYNIITASSNRKQVFIAKEDTYLTMFFATKVDNIEDAEEEFTNEIDILMSRHPIGINNITITGE